MTYFDWTMPYVLYLQCFLLLTTVDMSFNSQVLLYVRNITMVPVAKIKQAWNYFCWICLYSIKLLPHQFAQSVQ